jgi:hypothetical protein
MLYGCTVVREEFKLKEMYPAVQTDQPALQNMKFLPFGDIFPQCCGSGLIESGSESRSESRSESGSRISSES